MADLDSPQLSAEVEEAPSLTARAVELRTTAGQDRLRAGTLGILASIPILGGVLSEVVGTEIPATRERRIEDLLSRLAQHVDALDAAERAMADAPPPDYPAIVETVLEAVVRTSEEVKREAYAAILINALVQGGDEEERLLFLDLLQGSRPIHMRMLGVLSEDPGIDGATQRFRPWRLLRILLPEYSDELIRLAWSNLYDWGLLNTAGTDLDGTNRQAINLLAVDRRTPLGVRFVRFIARRS